MKCTFSDRFQHCLPFRFLFFLLLTNSTIETRRTVELKYPNIKSGWRSNEWRDFETAQASTNRIKLSRRTNNTTRPSILAPKLNTSIFDFEWMRVLLAHYIDQNRFHFSTFRRFMNLLFLSCGYSLHSHDQAFHSTTYLVEVFQCSNSIVRRIFSFHSFRFSALLFRCFVVILASSNKLVQLIVI